VSRVSVGALWVVACTLGAVGCGTAEAPGEAAAPVKVAAVVPGEVVQWVELFGRVVPPPDRDATIAPQVAGVLVAVGVREGDAVRSGEVVARVEPAPLRDAVAAAEAAERRAASEATFRRRTAESTRGLFEKGIASRQEAEADEAAAVGAEAALAEASSGLATARRRLGWADLRAPFDGVVVRVMRRAGDTVDGSPATPVVEVAAPTPVQVAADATAEALQIVAPKQRADITARDGATAALPARVIRVARSVDSATGTGEVRLALADPHASLVLGASVSIRIAVREKADALTVPAAALRHGPDGSVQVVVVEGDKASVRPVEVGIADRERVEVTSGLKAGESVVVDDPVGLTDGAVVSVRP
jgi:membrane fusion protein, multidrug efflux system